MTGSFTTADRPSPAALDHHPARPPAHPPDHRQIYTSFRGNHTK